MELFYLRILLRPDRVVVVHRRPFDRKEPAAVSPKFFRSSFRWRTLLCGSSSPSSPPWLRVPLCSRAAPCQNAGRRAILESLSCQATAESKDWPSSVTNVNRRSKTSAIARSGRTIQSAAGWSGQISFLLLGSSVSAIRAHWLGFTGMSAASAIWIVSLHSALRTS